MSNQPQAPVAENEFQRCTNKDCGRYQFGGKWSCRAMSDNACDRPCAAIPAGADVASIGDDKEFHRLAHLYRRFDKQEDFDAMVAHVNAWGSRIAAGAPAETPKPVGEVMARVHRSKGNDVRFYLTDAGERANLPDNTPLFAAQPAPASAGATDAARDVLAERQRQVQDEGWSPEHDDKYIDCELPRAAATYALCTSREQLKLCGIPAWPWPLHWWKPTDYRRNLVKAGALVLAEIERIDRAAMLAPANSEKPL